MLNQVMSIPSWPFMQEPLYRWFLFFGALIAISVAWRSILGFMK